jgi:acetyltransferase
VEVCNAAPEIDASLVIYVPQALSNPVDIAKSLIEITASKSFTILTVWIGGQVVEKASGMLNEAGIPTYETPERAVRAFIALLSYGRNLAALQEIPPRLSHDPEFDSETARQIIDDALDRRNQILTEIESKRLLATYGIPVNRAESARSPDEAVGLAKEIGFPLVMKIDSPDISHKSDAKAVRLDIRNEEEARRAFHEIMANSRAYNPQAELTGVSIQPMLWQPNYELILGCKKDPDFGPVLLFGMGGIMTEVLQDRSLCLPPLNRLLAARMIESTRVYQLLKGFRGKQPVNLELLEEILIRLSQLVMDFPEIVELDINPLMASGDQVLAADARVAIQRAEVLAPKHLVISPYPRQYE